MNCDAVLFALTSGPFPQGRASDVFIESHLEQCADCWRLAQALRPATDLLEESLPARDGRDLPNYWGDSRYWGDTRPPMAFTDSSSLAEVSSLATRTLVLPRTRAARQARVHVRANSDHVGWREIAQVTGFVLLLASAATGLAVYLSKT